MDIGSYIQDNQQTTQMIGAPLQPNVDRLHTFENVEERSQQSSFFDDITERQAIKEVVVDQNISGSDYNRSQPQMNLSDELAMGVHLRSETNNNHPSQQKIITAKKDEIDYEIEREISVYALDNVQSI